MKVAALAAGLVMLSAASPAITPRSVQREIRMNGARQTINRLERAHQCDAVTDAIDSGAPAWIALAPLLAPGSDAGSAEELGISLAFALPRSPRAVLAALDERNGVVLGADRVCGRPFIEDTEPKGYVRRTAAALASVHAPDLLARKQACLRALRAAR